MVVIDWNQFEQWLLTDHKRHVVVSMVSYAKHYKDCLLERDLSKVRALRESLRPNVMKALSALAKFLGMYQEYKQLIKSYGLKWGGRSSDDLLIDRLTKVQNPDEVFEWIRQVKAERSDLSVFMDFMAVTGLRFIEAIDSYNLIIELSREGKLNDYYNTEAGTLEHYKFKETFIRKSKKAFISFIPETLVKAISEEQTLSTNAVQSRIRKRNLKLRFGDIREVHGTFMTAYLKQPEIDFLHGRVSANVFMSNYFNPKMIGDLKQRTFKAIAEIQKKIS